MGAYGHGIAIRMNMVSVNGLLFSCGKAFGNCCMVTYLTGIRKIYEKVLIKFERAIMLIWTCSKRCRKSLKIVLVLKQVKQQNSLFLEYDVGPEFMTYKSTF